MVSPVDGARRAASRAFALRRAAGPSQGAAGGTPTGRGAASRAEPGPTPDGVEAVLRMRLRALGLVPEPGRSEAARIVVEGLLERELSPALRADPRFADWVDATVAALHDVPAWRDELARLVERLSTEA
jgi:hypothetical protein